MAVLKSVSVGDTFSSLEVSDRQVIPVSELYDVLRKIQDMLGKAGCNELVIQLVFEVFLANYVSRQHFGVLASQFCLHIIREHCCSKQGLCYIYINWNMVQVCKNLGQALPHSLASVRGDKAKTGFQFMLKGCLCHILVVHLQHRSLYLILELMVVRKAENIWSLICEFSGLLWWKEPVRVVFLMLLQCTTSVTASSVVHIDTLLSCWIDEMNNVQ